MVPSLTMKDVPSRALSARATANSHDGWNNLCQECRTIVEQAPRISLEWVSAVSETEPKQHPHMGALDEHGKGPFRYDPSRLRRNPPNPQKNLTHLCRNSVQDMHELSNVRLVTNSSTGNESTKAPRLLCGLYASQPYHRNVQRARETWGPQCDGFFVGSNATDAKYDAVNILHKGIEEYRNMYEKVRSIWSYIYHNYYNDYEWFHLGGDDMLLVVPNLKHYLASEEIQVAQYWNETHQTPMFLGLLLARGGDLKQRFVSGGPGYTLNRAALKLLVTEGFKTPGLRAAGEDFFISQLFKGQNVWPYPTMNAQYQPRYHHFTPAILSSPDSFKNRYRWFLNFSKPLNFSSIGPEYFDPNSVSFHFMQNDDMNRLHAVLHGECDNHTSPAAGPL